MPVRQDTTLSNTTSLSTDSEVDLYDKQRTEPRNEKSDLSRLYIDAFRFGEVLTGGDDATPTKFADLVGRDIESQELAATERFAKLSVNSWLQEGGLVSVGKIAEEPEGLDEYDESPSTPSTTEEAKPVAPAMTRSESVSKLSNEEIVKLLIDEFGSLTTTEDDVEQLISETDGCFFDEVAILGMIHLTTHRITFHASLLSVRPDMLPEKQILKEGAVTLHRPGLHRKRRVWLQLSHDMLTTFPSGSDKDRIRPIRSILLSTIKEIAVEEPNHPRRVHLDIEDREGMNRNYAEFDTIESARDWRKELSGALYMSKHRRAETLYQQGDDDVNGVRISIPLCRIEHHSTRIHLSFINLLNIQVSKFAPRVFNSAGEPVSVGGEENLEDTSESDDESDDILDTSSNASGDLFRESVDGRTVQFGIIHRADAWSGFKELVDAANEKFVNATLRVLPRTFVDFGFLTFTEQNGSDSSDMSSKEKTIRSALSLGAEKEIWYTKARVSKSVSSIGYFVITPNYIGFWTKSFSCKAGKTRLSITQILDAKPVYRYAVRTFGMQVDIKQRKSKIFDFATEELRNDVIRRIKQTMTNFRLNSGSFSSPSPVPSLVRSSSESFASRALTDSPGPLTPKTNSEANSSDGHIVSPPRSASLSMTSTDVLSPLALTIEKARERCIPTSDGELPVLPKVINLPTTVTPSMKPKHYVCLTIGSRGDVQPYIALAKGLQAKGQTVTIVTHEEYKEWVEGWGVEHRTAGGDPGALMKLSVEHKMFSPQFFKESLTNFRSWLDDLLVDAYEQCKDADVLLESPVAMAGVHIAEALKIPYFRVFTMPWTKTTQFPHPFLSAPADVSTFNSSTYVLFDNVYWKATSGQINRWRRKTLHLGNTDMDHLAQSKITFIYNFSPSVVPKPMDWGDAIIVSGYWFLDNPDLGWTCPPDLEAWLKKARDDGKAIVYIGFGSITVPNPAAMTRSIIKAVAKSGVRAIVSKGWSSRMSKPGDKEVEFPPECYPIDKIPHDWLFPQIDAALHHGGAGTTGASLRAGIPTLIKPWFGDQFFWASRVHKLGAGLRVHSLHSADLASALTKATTDRVMKERATAVGEKIRSENGVEAAIQAIWRYTYRAGRVRTEIRD